MRRLLNRARTSHRVETIVRDGGIVSHIAHLALLVISLHSIEGAIATASVTFILLGHICITVEKPLSEVLTEATEAAE